MQPWGSFVCGTVSRIHLTEIVHLSAKRAESRRATLAERAAELSVSIQIFSFEF